MKGSPEQIAKPVSAAVEMRQLTVGYNRRPVLSGIDWSIDEGALTAIVGANGSGKSTLLKTIAGILPPISGEVRISRTDGKTPAIGYVPQSESLDAMFLFSNLDVVLMGACGRVGPGRGIPKREKQKAAECLNSVGMEEFGKRRFSEMSGGQKQRVLVARALMVSPDLLLLDEPTSGIDPAAAQLIMELLTRIHRGQEMTIVMVTHDIAVVRRYLPEMVWLDQGQLRFGPAEALLNEAGSALL